MEAWRGRFEVRRFVGPVVLSDAPSDVVSYKPTLSGRMKHRGQQPVLVLHEGVTEVLSGREVLDEVFDLIRYRLPYLATEDPVRQILSAVLPSPGRPALAPVPAERHGLQ